VAHGPTELLNEKWISNALLCNGRAADCKQLRFSHYEQTATDNMVVFILWKITGNELSFQKKYNVTHCAFPHTEAP
jgi:hypothetical protein